MSENPNGHRGKNNIEGLQISDMHFDLNSPNLTVVTGLQTYR